MHAEAAHDRLLIGDSREAEPPLVGLAGLLLRGRPAILRMSRAA